MRLIEVPEHVSFGETTSQYFNNLKKSLIGSYNRSLSVATNQFGKVQRTNLLHRIIMDGYVNPELDVYEYMRIVDSRIQRLIRIFGLTSPVSVGKIHEGNMYSNSSEVFIACETELDLRSFLSNWKNNDSVSVLTHPVTSMDFGSLEGNHASTNDFSIMLLDLRKLFLAFRQYVLDTRLKNSVNATNIIPSIRYFLHRYVYWNAMRSHIDIVIINKMKSLGYDEVRYGDQMNKMTDTVLRIVRGTINDRSMSFGKIIKSIPHVFSNTGDVNFYIPDITKTRQVWWGVMIARLNLFETLIDLTGESGYQNNKGVIYRMLNSYEQMFRERMIPVAEYDIDILRGRVSDIAEKVK